MYIQNITLSIKETLRMKNGEVAGDISTVAGVQIPTGPLEQKPVLCDCFFGSISISKILIE